MFKSIIIESIKNFVQEEKHARLIDLFEKSWQEDKRNILKEINKKKKDNRLEWKKNNCEKVKESNRKNYVKRYP